MYYCVDCKNVFPKEEIAKGKKEQPCCPNCGGTDIKNDKRRRYL